MSWRWDCPNCGPVSDVLHAEAEVRKSEPGPIPYWKRNVYVRRVIPAGYRCLECDEPVRGPRILGEEDFVSFKKGRRGLPSSCYASWAESGDLFRDRDPYYVEGFQEEKHRHQRNEAYLSFDSRRRPPKKERAREYDQGRGDEFGPHARWVVEELERRRLERAQRRAGA